MAIGHELKRQALPIVVNEILVDAAKRGSSDIHFDPTETTVKIRYRIDGEFNYLDRQIKFHLSLAGTKKMLSQLDLSKTDTIYLMHLSEEASEPEVMKEVVAATFNKKVVVFLREGDTL